MKKTFISIACILTFSLSTISCITAQNKASNDTSLNTKVENIATITENVIAITGTATGNAQVDNFLNSTSSLLQKYRTVNNTLSAIKVLKGDNGTTIMNDGNSISKIAAIGQLTGITKQLSTIGSESLTSVKTGTTLLQSLSNSTNQKDASTIGKIETAINALTLLGIEVPKSVSTTTSLLKAIKGN